MIGIYEIRNIKTNVVYVGSSVHILRRFNDHKRLLRQNKHHTIKLQRAWNKYGKDSFVFAVLKEVEQDLLKSTEQEILDLVSANRKMYYNISIDASCPTRGRKMSKATIEKKIRLAATKEWKERQSNALKEYFKDSEARKKVSDTVKEFNKANPEHHKKTQELRLATLKKKKRAKKFAIDSAASTIRWSNPEERAKQSERTTNWFYNPENRAKTAEKTIAFYSNPENRKAASLRQPSKLSSADIAYIKEQGKIYGMQTKLCAQFNLGKSHISNIVNNKALPNNV